MEKEPATNTNYTDQESKQYMDDLKNKTKFSFTLKETNPQYLWLHFDEIDSTHTYSEIIIDEIKLASKPLLIQTEGQTAGRGQFKGSEQRTWFSPKNLNLYANFIIKAPTDCNFKEEEIRNFYQIISLCIVKTLRQFLGDEGKDHSIEIKQQNDILMNGKKVCGHLTNIYNTKVNGRLLMSGIGINVNMEDFSQISQKATSLFAETKKKWDKDELLRQLSLNIIEFFNNFCSNGYSYFQSEIASKLAFVGQQISVNADEKQEYSGLYKGINEKGDIVLISNETKETVIIENGSISLK